MSPVLCLLALFAVGAAAPAGPAREEPAQDPGPPHKLAGLHGLVARWRLTPPGAPQADATLTATYAFPDRARLQLEPDGGRSSDRHVTYRFGGRLWALEPRVATSRGLTGEERCDALLEVELRRAALLWPADLEWTALLGASQGELEAELGAAGRLRAHVPAPGERPTRLRALDAQGRERAGLGGLAWGERDGRVWPERWTFTRPGLMRVERLEKAAGGRYLDDQFLPVELRPPGPRSVRQPVRRVALAERVARRVPLAEPASPEAALAEADRRIAAEGEALARRGLTLEPGPTLELDDAGRPVALWLVLETPPAEPPPGWVRHPACAAVARLLPSGVGQLSIGDLRALREAAEGRTEGPALLGVLPPDRIPRRAEVRWPLAR